VFAIVEGVPQGKALDIVEGSPVESYDAALKGSNDYADIECADLASRAGAYPRKAGPHRMRAVR